MARIGKSIETEPTDTEFLDWRVWEEMGSGSAGYTVSFG